MVIDDHIALDTCTPVWKKEQSNTICLIVILKI